MSREQERIRKKLENNPIAECNKIQNRYCPELFSMFDRVKDPRHQSYIDYSSRVMLGTMYYKSIAGISSMQEMTRTFNDEKICRNLYTFMGEDAKEYMPHGVTENEFLERLDPRELESVQQNIVYSMIRRKTFDNARVLKKWQVIVDATELDEGFQKKNEYVRYHRSILEAKIYFGENLVCSIASETIENSEEYINQSDEAVKQDCESKAFVRLAARIKKKFPRLPIIITADGLYVTKKVLQICKDYHWDYIIRYKEGCAPSIAREYRALPEKETEFAWITGIEITKSNAKKIVRAGRNRWKIENQGFNRQKHWQGNIEHACSFHERAQKNHYLMEQIADFVKQLYEYFYLEKNGIKKLQKNISSELLASFGRQLTETEDIPAQLNKSVQN